MTAVNGLFCDVLATRVERERREQPRPLLVAYPWEDEEMHSMTPRFQEIARYPQLFTEGHTRFDVIQVGSAEASVRFRRQRP